MEKEFADTKTLNVRTEKWREMIKMNMFKDRALVSKRVRKGIPPGMRQVVWPRLLDIDSFRTQSKESYEQLIRQRSGIEGEIRLDIPRTYTEQKAQLMRVSLFNVLKALSLVYPELGYCQGMNHLSMKLLEILPDETGFWIMNYLIRTYRNILWNYKNPSTTELQNYVLSSMMEKYCPQVLSILNREKIDLTAFTPRWFITLFSSSLPTEVFYRVFECMLVEGYVIIYKAAITMMKINEPFLLNNSYEDALGNLMGKKQFVNIAPDDFCHMMYSFSLTTEEMVSLENRFVAQNNKKVMNWQEDSQKSYQRRILEKKLAMEEVADERMSSSLNMAEFKKAPFQLYRFQ